MSEIPLNIFDDIKLTNVDGMGPILYSLCQKFYKFSGPIQIFFGQEFNELRAFLPVTLSLLLFGLLTASYKHF